MSKPKQEGLADRLDPNRNTSCVRSGAVIGCVHIVSHSLWFKCVLRHSFVCVFDFRPLGNFWGPNGLETSIVWYCCSRCWESNSHIIQYCCRHYSGFNMFSCVCVCSCVYSLLFYFMWSVCFRPSGEQGGLNGIGSSILGEFCLLYDYLPRRKRTNQSSRLILLILPR